MVKRLSDSEIWKKDWFLDLTDKQKLLVKFLFDNCDCSGVYEISRRMLRTCFEQDITREDFEAIRQVKFIEDNKVFLEDFIPYTYKTTIPLLNPLNKVHKGVLACLEKHNLLTLTKQLPNCTEVKVKEEVKISNTSNSKIDNSIIENNNNQKPTKKIDPYVNNTNELFSKEYEKVFNTKPYLLNNQRNKLAELAAEIEDFKETIPVALQKLKNVEFDLPNFTADYLWLLKDDNYIKVLSGTYDKKKTEWEQMIENYEVDEYGN